MLAVMLRPRFGGPHCGSGERLNSPIDSICLRNFKTSSPEFRDSLLVLLSHKPIFGIRGMQGFDILPIRFSAESAEMEGESGGSGESEVRFDAYVESLAGVLGHADRVAPLKDYCTGLLMPGERKSVEPMAS